MTIRIAPNEVGDGYHVFDNGSFVWEIHEASDGSGWKLSGYYFLSSKQRWGSAKAAAAWICEVGRDKLEQRFRELADRGPRMVRIFSPLPTHDQGQPKHSHAFDVFTGRTFCGKDVSSYFMPADCHGRPTCPRCAQRLPENAIILPPREELGVDGRGNYHWQLPPNFLTMQTTTISNLRERPTQPAPPFYAITWTTSSAHTMPEAPWYIVAGPKDTASEVRDAAITEIGEIGVDSYLQQEHDHLIVVAEVDLDYYRIDMNHVRNGQRRSWYVSKHTAER